MWVVAVLAPCGGVSGRPVSGDMSGVSTMDVVAFSLTSVYAPINALYGQVSSLHMDTRTHTPLIG